MRLSSKKKAYGSSRISGVLAEGGCVNSEVCGGPNVDGSTKISGGRSSQVSLKTFSQRPSTLFFPVKTSSQKASHFFPPTYRITLENNVSQSSVNGTR